MTKAIALVKIKAAIMNTNNGKLMKMRLAPELRGFVADLIADGKLSRATFMEFADSITLPAFRTPALL